MSTATPSTSPTRSRPRRETHPAALEPFQAFNLVDGPGVGPQRLHRPSTCARPATFLRRAPRLGLRPATVGPARPPACRRASPTRRPGSGGARTSRCWPSTCSSASSGEPGPTQRRSSPTTSRRPCTATGPPPSPSDYPAEDVRLRRRVDRALVAASWARPLGHADRMLARLRDHCERDGLRPRRRLVDGPAGRAGHARGPPAVPARPRHASSADAGVDPALVERTPGDGPAGQRPDRTTATASNRAAPATPDAPGRRQRPIVWHEEDDGFVSMEFGQADDAIGDIEVDGEVREPACPSASRSSRSRTRSPAPATTFPRGSSWSSIPATRWPDRRPRARSPPPRSRRSCCDRLGVVDPRRTTPPTGSLAASG